LIGGAAATIVNARTSTVFKAGLGAWPAGAADLEWGNRIIKCISGKMVACLLTPASTKVPILTHAGGKG
jgi:hypothetical protein